MMKGLSIERLRSFLQVVDAEGFARAAPGEPVRQSQLSRQVSELEGALGAKLLERRGRGIAVTEAGEKLAIVVREMLRGLEDVTRHAPSADIPFSLGAGDSLLHWWVVPRLGDFAKRMSRGAGGASPASLSSLSSEDVVTRLLEARLDFGLIRAKEVPSGLSSKPLGELSYALYVPRKLRAKHETKDPTELLVSLPLAIQTSEPELQARLLAAGRQRGREPNVALRCETFPQACRAVRSGHFAALLPTIADIELPDREIEELKLPGLGRFTVSLHLAWHPRTTRRNAGLERVAETLSSCLTLEDD